MSPPANVATVTLNPAIDRTVSIPGFRAGQVNRVEHSQAHAGGKGVNVASFLADVGITVAATGFLGAENPLLFEALFARKGINDCFLRIPGSTRTGIKIVDERAHETTDINFPGQSLRPEHIGNLLQALRELATDCSWIVLSGSIPPGVPPDIYAQLIRVAKSAGASVALDASGEALREAIPALPDLVKPNVEELEQLLARDLPTREDVLGAARELLDRGIGTVVVSMGAEGAIFAESGEAIVAEPPQVEVKSTVAAGDAMVAGTVVGKLNDDPLPDCATLATAFALAAVTRVATDLPGPDMIQAFSDQVRIVPV